MALTANIIEHELAGVGEIVRANPDENGSYTDVRIYAEGCGAEEGMLYVCDASECAQAVSGGCRQMLAVVSLAEGADGDSRACCGAVMLIRTSYSKLEIFTKLQQVYLRYREWERALDASCLENEGVQRLLDLSTPFLKNHLVIVDPALKLLGHTRDIPCDDPVTMELIEHGYHTEGNIRKFKLNKRFAPWATQDGFVVNDTFRICKYVTVVYSFKTRDSFSIIVVMMCNRVDPEGWLLDAYRMFVDRVRRYAERDYPADKPSGSAVDAFLCDLLANRIGDDAAIKERCEHAGIPYAARFCLFHIPANADAVPTLRLLSDVSRSVAPAKTLMVDGSVTVLCFNCHSDSCARHCMAGSCPLERKAISVRLNELMTEYGLICGRSSKFSTLSQAYTAFLQAREAAGIGFALQGKKPSIDVTHNWDRIYSFDSCCIDYLVKCSMIDGQNLARASYGCRILDEIAEQDAVSNTDNYRFLYEYLRCERRASVVAERLHMHRNNVKYRIDRIEQLHGIDTDDPRLRYDLAMAYHVRESSLMQNAQ